MQTHSRRIFLKSPTDLLHSVYEHKIAAPYDRQSIAAAIWYTAQNINDNSIPSHIAWGYWSTHGSYLAKEI